MPRDTTHASRVAQVVREIKSLAVENGPFGPAGRIKPQQFAAIADMAARSLKSNHTPMDLAIWLSSATSQVPKNFCTVEEQRLVERRRNGPQIAPGDEGREMLRSMPAGELLEWWNLHGPKPKKVSQE